MRDVDHDGVPTVRLCDRSYTIGETGTPVCSTGCGEQPAAPQFGDPWPDDSEFPLPGGRINEALEAVGAVGDAAVGSVIAAAGEAQAAYDAHIAPVVARIGDYAENPGALVDAAVRYYQNVTTIGDALQDEAERQALAVAAFVGCESDARNGAISPVLAAAAAHAVNPSAGNLQALRDALDRAPTAYLVAVADCRPSETAAEALAAMAAALADLLEDINDSIAELLGLSDPERVVETIFGNEGGVYQNTTGQVFALMDATREVVLRFASTTLEQFADAIERADPTGLAAELDELANDPQPAPGKAGLAVLVRDEKGAPLVDVVLRVAGANQPPQTKNTSSAGRASFDLEPNELYTITASKPGYLTKADELRAGGPGSGQTLAVELASEKPATAQFGIGAGFAAAVVAVALLAVALAYARKRK